MHTNHKEEIDDIEEVSTPAETFEIHKVIVDKGQE